MAAVLKDCPIWLLLDATDEQARRHEIIRVACRLRIRASTISEARYLKLITGLDRLAVRAVLARSMVE